MLSLFALMPPSPFAQKAIAGLVGYVLFLFFIVRGSRVSPIFAFAVGPAAACVATVAYHSVQGRYGSGDLGYSFLIGIITAVVIGGCSVKRSETDRRLPDTLGWVFAALAATVIVTVVLYGIWYATAWPSERQFDATIMFMRFVQIGLLAGLPVTLILFVLQFVRTAKK